MGSEPKNDYAEGYYWVRWADKEWGPAQYLGRKLLDGAECWIGIEDTEKFWVPPLLVGERIERTEPTQATGGDAMMHMYVLVSKVNNGYQINVDGINRYIANTKEEALALVGKELGIITKVPDEGTPGRLFQGLR